MNYNKLNKHMTEICNNDEPEVKRQLVKDYVKQNIEKCSNYYFLKNDPTLSSKVLIFGSDGEYYELSDGSKLSIDLFEKLYRTKESDILVDPNVFFSDRWTANVDINEKKRPIDSTPITSEFLNNYAWSNNIKEFFDKIDPTNLKYDKPSSKVRGTPFLDHDDPKPASDKVDEWRKNRKKKGLRFS